MVSASHRHNPAVWGSGMHLLEVPAGVTEHSSVSKDTGDAGSEVGSETSWTSKGEGETKDTIGVDESSLLGPSPDLETTLSREAVGWHCMPQLVESNAGEGVQGLFSFLPSADMA